MAPEPMVRAQAVPASLPEPVVPASSVESFTCESSAATVVRSDFAAMEEPVGDV
jgi:hypothetical protein